MGPISEQVGDELLSAVLQEAADEVHGRSSRKWGVALVGVLVGVVIGVVILKVRRQRLAAQGDTEQAPLPGAPAAPATLG